MNEHRAWTVVGSDERALMIRSFEDGDRPEGAFVVVDAPRAHEAEVRVAALVAALESSRFALHCALLGYEHEDDREGVEVTVEVLAEAQAALVAACAPAPPRPICSGCSPIAGLEDADLVRRWREKHPQERDHGLVS